MMVLRVGKRFIEWPKEIIPISDGRVLVIAEKGQYLVENGELKEISAKFAAYLLARKLIKSLPSSQ